MNSLKCLQCGRLVSSECAKIILIGDTYFEFKCADCSADGRENFTRLTISWVNLLQLVLFHLWVQSGRKQRYFRWKEDICKLIDDRWNDLIPTKKKSFSWMNSVSSVLSANDVIFASGLTVKGVPGWWGLHQWTPPIVSAMAHEESDELLNSKRSYNGLRGDGRGFDDDGDILLSSEDESNVTNNADADGESVASSEESKALNPNHQLLERLLMMDSSLLQEAIKKAKAKQKTERKLDKRAKKMVTESEPLEQNSEETVNVCDEKQDEAIAVEGLVDPLKLKECLALLEAFKIPLPSPDQQPINRPSPVEGDLIKKCNRSLPHPALICRLRRKLILRKERRRLNWPIFDLDTAIYLFLKNPERALVLQMQPEPLTAQSTPTIKFPQSLDPQTIPYMTDPARSMFVKLTGLGAIYGQVPYPITSPFTGKLLDPFIELQNHTLIPKLRLLSHLAAFRPEASEVDAEDGKNEQPTTFEPLLQPSMTKTTLLTSEQLKTVDYIHLRKEFVGQINDLLALSFWPGIDVSEALDYPDYTTCVLVGHSVVGCGFVTPEGYLSYLHVRPDFQGFGIASKILHILLEPIASHKDITLHVSVTNTPAILLYQRYGFKPEEFIVNFYDKYYPAEYTEHSRNAFLMRLRR